MSDKNTNFRCKGRLGADPKAITTQAGKLVVEISVAVQPNKKYPVCWFNFVSLTNSVSEDILENYVKGDFIQITDSSPTAPSIQAKIQAPKFVIWDIEYKGERAPEPTTPQDPGPGDEDIPY